MATLRSLPGFRSIPPAELDELDSIMVPEAHAAGTVLFREGDDADAFYIVVAGEVAILKDAWAGKRLDTLGPGEFFGEMGVVEQAPRFATARAVTDVSLVKVRGLDFRALLARSPSFAMRIMATIARRNRENVGQESGSRPQPAAGRHGRLFVACSMTGGAGVSTVASNVAAELASQSGGKVCLVDASVEFGDLALMLDMVPAATLAHLAQEPILTPEILGHAILRTQGGFDLLPAPLKPEQGDLLTGDFFRQLFNLLRALYDHVVVDTGRGMREPMPTLLEESDELVYVLTPRLNALKNARLFAGLLSAMGLSDTPVHWVLNGSTSETDLKTLTQSLGRPCSAVVPFSPAQVADCLDRGQLVCREEPESPVAESLARIARGLLGAEEPAAGKMSWIRKSQWLRRLRFTRAEPQRAAAGS